MRNDNYFNLWNSSKVSPQKSTKWLSAWPTPLHFSLAEPASSLHINWNLLRVWEHTHCFSKASVFWYRQVSDFWDHWMEMSGTIKPVTSFLIEDILSSKNCKRVDGKCSSPRREKCSDWREESEKLSTHLYPEESAFGMHTGEHRHAWNNWRVKYRESVNGFACDVDELIQHLFGI